MSPAGASSRSGSAGSVNDQPTTSCSPRPTSTSSARRRSRCARVSRPGSPVRFSWIVAGSFSSAVEPRDLLDQVGLARDVARGASAAR